MDDVLTFEKLQKALELIKGDCDHLPYYKIHEYYFLCKCRTHSYLSCPPELKEWFDNLDWKEPENGHIEEIFGIKVYRSGM